MFSQAENLDMNHPLEQFAAFGAEPAFREPLFVGKPNIGDRDELMKRINDLLDRKWLTNAGQYEQRFEKALQRFLGVRHCIPICNGTIALELAIRALGLKGEVIVPSFTFVATAHALQWQEIKPVFCDIDPITATIDPTRVEELITPNTTGIIGVHLWGRPCNTGALQEIAQRHGLKLLFDAAHALGVSRNGRMIGNFGNAEIFSFHATKVVNAFEGGAIATNDDELAEKLRLMRNFGFSGFDNVIYIGTNGKMSEVSAAMGLTSLEAIDEFVDVNRRNYHCYKKGLEGLPGIKVVEYDEQEATNYQYLVLEIDAGDTGLSRDDLMRVLHAENVVARRYFYPGCHRMEPYRSYQPQAGLLLGNTERLASRVLVMPTGTGVGTEDIDKVCNIVAEAVRNGRAVTEALAFADGA